MTTPGLLRTGLSTQAMDASVRGRHDCRLPDVYVLALLHTGETTTGIAAFVITRGLQFGSGPIFRSMRSSRSLTLPPERIRGTK